MCRIFTSQDPATYAAETRAVRLHGHATSIRLEAAFWATLEQIAAAEGLTVTRFITVLHDEILARHGDIPNLASFLRVTCMHWLRNQDAHAQEVARRQAIRETALPAA
ncbi:Aryl-sulfate sulfotransferase [Rhodovastum atsumiense]|uniref:Aryl-sulfate sulfotransferase n=1 Tax=Rhodovastum atsumiense TaxID=504468 RepID=A0A5M6IQL4_9PROT|nr:ribbon-helix-helix domain-containing protein [Rhodovastum atsumiense]KAA5610217.1 aryl-sulfate sulfotransferase [Rhodovastum atsumiense]CAH2604167.1 Aryl-sulfate sulfotransferase [Rhodovastum atsumiense]